jgi:hypothetical protein
MAKLTVIDPSGAQWSVRRWWFKTIPYETGVDFLDFIIFIIVLPFMIAWPFWLERDGQKAGEEKVRGWRKSGVRINEIAQSAQAGTFSLPAA